MRPSLEVLEERAVPATLPSGFVESVVATGITNATAMEFAPNGDLWALEQGGRVLRFTANSATADVVGNLTSLGLTATGERGLLGIAFDPDYASNKYVYLYYTTTTGYTHNVVARFQVVDTNPADYYLAGMSNAPPDAGVFGTPVQHVVLHLDALSTATNHNGGAIHFGPDDKLYIATGDNANGANAQSMSTLHGKLLRINADGTIPGDNPFSGSAIWALGLRNPFTFAFRPGSSEIYINDVGAGSFEEINVGTAGANYGWPATEGDFNQGSFPGFTRPYYAYAHGTGTFQGFAITGGAFYEAANETFPAEYAGDYFFADFAGGWINVIDTTNPAQVRRFATAAGAPVDLRVSDDGSLYYLDRATGRVYRVQYADGPAVSTFVPSATNSLIGTAVGDLAGGSGGAVVGLGATQTGLWQFSLDGGATWQNFGNPSESTARLLESDDRVRFLPSLSYLGGATLTFRSWNETGGSAGGVVDLSGSGSTGPGTPFGATTTTSAVVEGAFVLRGSSLTVLGTAGGDTFIISAGVTPTFTRNGVLYTMPGGVVNIGFNGLGGIDVAGVHGTTAGEAALLQPGAGVLQGPNYSVGWSSTETVYAYGNGGSDTAALYDSTGNDTFASQPAYAYLLTPSVINWAVGFGVVYGYSMAGGSDLAVLYDSAGSDVFQANAKYAYMTGPGYIDWAVGFEAVYAQSVAGGSDAAYLFDSPGNDVFTGSGAAGVLSLATGHILGATGFDLVAALGYAGGVNRLSLGALAYVFQALGSWV